MTYKIKDMRLGIRGIKRIHWAEDHMPVMKKLREKYEDSKPLKGYKISGAIHVTKETAVLATTLQAMGAEVAWAGCNPLSTQNDIAAALARGGIHIYAEHGCNTQEYYECIDAIINHNPQITMDDGCDVVVRLHKLFPDKLENIIGGTEETTTGVHRLESMAAAGKLKYPIIAVNNAETKWDFDNIYGTGQGTIDGILRATSVMITGKTFVVAGYGHCGKGVAMRAEGMGANVIVTEIDPLQALKARMDGYRVMPMDQAVKEGDIFVTATGISDVIRKRHFSSLKDGAILSNTGHFDCEVDIAGLKEYAKEVENLKENLDEYILPDGRQVYVLAEGRLVNLSAAEGHASEVMDLSFANQVLSVLRLTQEKLPIAVNEIPSNQDQLIAKMKLESMGIKIDKLTQKQIKYRDNFEEGT